jgi:hypothetical protein
MNGRNGMELKETFLVLDYYAYLVDEIVEQSPGTELRENFVTASLLN